MKQKLNQFTVLVTQNYHCVSIHVYKKTKYDYLIYEQNDMHFSETPVFLSDFLLTSLGKALQTTVSLYRCLRVNLENIFARSSHHLAGFLILHPLKIFKKETSLTHKRMIGFESYFTQVCKRLPCFCPLIRIHVILMEPVTVRQNQF